MGFTPAIGETYSIIRYGSSAGKFKNISGLALDDGLFLHPEYTPTGILLRVKSVTHLAQCTGKPNHWGGESYAQSTESLCGKGCLLTALSMALNFEGVSELPAGAGMVPNDPGHLNDFMNQHAGDYNGAQVNLGRTVLTINDMFPGLRLTLRMDYWGSRAATNLLKVLETGHPVIVGVRSPRHLQDSFPPEGHFVLVTGCIRDANNEPGDFLIVDPAGYGHQRLSEYGNVDFKGQSDFLIQGWVEDPPENLTLVSFALPENTDLMVTDPLGRRTGFDPGEGQLFTEIPDASYSNYRIVDDETGDSQIGGEHTVSIFQPRQGIYRVTLTGLADGSYTLKSDSFTPHAILNPLVTRQGTLFRGAVQTLLIPVGTTLALTSVDQNSRQLRLATDTALPFRIEVSTNLTSWSVLGTVVPADGVASFTEVTASSTASRFYRAVSE